MTSLFNGFIIDSTELIMWVLQIKAKIWQQWKFPLHSPRHIFST